MLLYLREDLDFRVLEHLILLWKSVQQNLPRNFKSVETSGQANDQADLQPGAGLKYVSKLDSGEPHSIIRSASSQLKLELRSRLAGCCNDRAWSIFVAANRQTQRNIPKIMKREIQRKGYTECKVKTSAKRQTN